MHNHKKLRIFLRFLNLITLYLPTLFWILLIYGFDTPCTAGLTVISAIIHECGHGACLLLGKDKKSRLVGNLSGFRISRKTTDSYQADAALYASGPLLNFAAALVAAPFIRTVGEYAFLFAVINAATGISNLMPIRGYDGYGLIRALLCRVDKWDALQEKFEFLSLLSVSLTLILSLYVLSRIGDGYWTAGLFILSLIKEATEGLNKRFSRFKEISGENGRFKEFS
jgi:Zn-dependent protease